MIITEIKNYIEDYINYGVEIDFDKIEVNESSLDHYRIKTVKRFLNIHKSYENNDASESDYLCALRNLLLVFDFSLRLNDDSVTSDRFGIYKDEVNGEIYAALNVPSFIKHPEFVSRAYMRGYTPSLNRDLNMFNLVKPPYIRSLNDKYSAYKTLGQKLAVTGSLKVPDGYTSLTCLPTGGGKSLITQSVAYQKEGLTIVIVPTVSLAIDQVKTAKADINHNTDDEIYCYYSNVKNSDKIFKSIEKHKLRLLFISPEALLKNQRFEECIEKANAEKYIKNIVIDEAHTVIAWGTYFRVDYQCLEPWRRKLMRTNPAIRTYLLSATFTENNIKLLKKMFSEHDKWIEIRCDKLRQEPTFTLVSCNGYTDKKKKLIKLIDLLPRPMIVYVSSPHDAKNLKEYLESRGYENFRLFTGETGSDDRESIIKEWSSNEFDLLIGTSAFGVGVNKSDVRTVLHACVSESTDMYYQELGRGGRDGLPCLSVMCINEHGENNDIYEAKKKNQKVLTKETLFGRWWSMYTSPTTTRGSLITIDTGVKPEYNKEQYFDRGNTADKNWNMYVLLFLRRHDFISIEDIQYDAATDRYWMQIIIKDERLMDENADKEYLEEARASEYNAVESNFKLLEETIKYEEDCWSEMFFETYSNVSAYCAGCIGHVHIRNEEPDRFALIKKVEFNNAIDKKDELFGDTNEIIIYYGEDEKQLLINKLLELDVTMFISNEYGIADYLSNDSSNTLKIYSFNELSKLSEMKSTYFLDDKAAVFYESNAFLKMNAAVQKYKRLNRKVIHLVNNQIRNNSEIQRFEELFEGIKYTLGMIGGE